MGSTLIINAITAYGKALTIKLVGPNHSSTAVTYNNMAIVYDNQGKSDIRYGYPIWIRVSDIHIRYRISGYPISGYPDMALEYYVDLSRAG